MTQECRFGQHSTLEYKERGLEDLMPIPSVRDTELNTSGHRFEVALRIGTTSFTT